MPLLPLALPPGVHANGTALQSAGRWRDASLVRWTGGTMQPVGGWSSRVDVAPAPPRAALAWETLAGDRYFAVGTYNGCYAVTSANTITDITPAGLTAGTADAAVLTGYGMGTFGSGFYGTPRAAYGNWGEATTWSLDAWGEELIACSSADGRIWSWDLNAANNLVAVTNAPTGCLGALVTDERFLFALGAGGNPRNVAWSDREARTTWTPAATNEAGDIDLATAGQIMCGLKLPGRTLVLTDEDAHAATYVGPPFVYGWARVGTSCGTLSRKAAVAVDGRAFWMGHNGFHMWDGAAVVPLACAVADDVFGRLNIAQQTKVYAVANSQHGEVWWFFPQGVENDRYAVYNYRENHWAIGALARTAGFDRGVFRSPMWFGSDGMAYDHETGLNMDGATVYAQSGPIQLGQGDEIMAVTDLLPDEATLGDVTATFTTRFEPHGTERTYGPYTLAARTSVRFSGRQMTMKVTGARLADWRVGVMRIEATGAGRR